MSAGGGRRQCDPARVSEVPLLDDQTAEEVFGQLTIKQHPSTLEKHRNGPVCFLFIFPVREVIHTLIDVVLISVSA